MLTFGFYDSLNGDRKYNARQWSSMFDGVINNGVFQSIGDKFMVTVVSGLTLKIGSGRAWFDHSWFLSDGDENNPVEFTWDSASDLAPEPVLKRIDAVVMETNSSPAVRANSIKVLKGTPSSTPVKPEMTKSDYVNQYPIAYVTVNPGITSFTQADIENAVGSSATPYVTGILQVTSIDNIVAQWQSEFSNWKLNEEAQFVAWFETLQDWLTEDEAAALAAEILKLKRTLTGTFYANAWTEIRAGVYQQTASVPAISINDNPIMVSQLNSLYSIEDAKAYNKAFGILCQGIGETGDNEVTLTVFKEPEIDILVGFRGA